jgi:hypothetical protein
MYFVLAVSCLKLRVLDFLDRFPGEREIVENSGSDIRQTISEIQFNRPGFFERFSDHYKKSWRFILLTEGYKL